MLWSSPTCHDRNRLRSSVAFRNVESYFNILLSKWICVRHSSAGQNEFLSGNIFRNGHTGTLSLPGYSVKNFLIHVLIQGKSIQNKEDTECQIIFHGHQYRYNYIDTARLNCISSLLCARFCDQKTLKETNLHRLCCKCEREESILEDWPECTKQLVLLLVE